MQVRGLGGIGGAGMVLRPAASQRQSTINRMSGPWGPLEAAVEVESPGGGVRVGGVDAVLVESMQCCYKQSRRHSVDLERSGVKEGWS